MAEQNIIEVVIRSVDNLSKDLADINARLVRTESTIKGVSDASQPLTSNWAKLGVSLVVLNQGIEVLNRVLGPLQEQFSAGVREAAQMQSVVTQLNSTLEIFGKTIPTQEVTAFATEMQKSIGVSDTQVVQITRLLASMTDLDNDGLKQVTKGIIGMSLALGTDLNSAAFQVSAVLNGFTNRIRGTTIRIDENVPLIERQAALMKQLAPLFSVAEKNAGTYEAQQRKLNTTIEDFQRAIGAPLLSQMQALQPTTIKIVESMAEWAQRNPAVAASVGVVTKAVGLLSDALLVLAAIKIAGIGSQLTALGVQIAAFATSPVGIAVLAVSAVGAAAAAAALEKYKTEMDDLAASQSAETAAKRIERLNQQIKTMKITASSDPSIKILEDRVKKISELSAKAQDALKQGAGVGAAGPTLAEQPGRIMQEAMDRALKQIQEFSEKATPELAKARADVAAAAQQMLYEETGDIAALEKSFAITQQGIAASAAATMNNQMKQMAEQLKLTPGQLEELAGPMKAVAGEQARLQMMQLEQQRQKQLFQLREQTFQSEIGYLKAIQGGDQTVLEIEQKRLELLKQRNAPTAVQFAQVETIAKQEQANHQNAIANLETEAGHWQSLVDLGNLRGLKLNEAVTQLARINAELEKERQTTAEVTANTEKQRAAIVSAASAKQLQVSQIAGQQIDTVNQAIVDNLEKQLENYKLQEAPVSQILEVSRQLDAMDRKLLDTQVAQLEAQARLKQERLDQGGVLADEVDVYKAELDLLNTQVSVLKTKQGLTVGARELREMIDTRNTAESMARDLSGQFVDRFIELIQGKKNSLDNFFINLGKTITSEFLQAMITELLKKPILDLLMSTTGGQTKQYQQFGVGGTLFGAIKEYFFPSAAPQSGAQAGAAGPATPQQMMQTGQSQLQASFDSLNAILGTAGTNLTQAGTQQITAASQLQTAGTQLIAAAAQLASLTGGGGTQANVLSETATALSDMAGIGGVTDTEAWDEAQAAVTKQAGAAADSSKSMGSLDTSTGAVIDSFGKLTQSTMNLAATAGQGGAGGIMGNIMSGLGIFKSIFDIFSMFKFGKGGMVIPGGQVRTFAGGGVVRGPTLGVIGEEGPEIVARMKPAGQHDLRGDQSQGQADLANAGDALDSGATSLDSAGTSLDSAGTTLDTAGGSLDLAGFTLDRAGMAMDQAAMSLDASSMMMAEAASALVKKLNEKGLQASAIADSGAFTGGQGLTIPQGFIRRFQKGGVATGPTLAMVGDGGEPEYIIPQSRMGRAGKPESNVQVQINGDITPRRPDMTPDEIIKIVVSNGEARGPVGHMVANVLRRNR